MGMHAFSRSAPQPGACLMQVWCLVCVAVDCAWVCLCGLQLVKALVSECAAYRIVRHAAEKARQLRLLPVCQATVSSRPERSLHSAARSNLAH